jgi:hypothetical protein
MLFCWCSCGTTCICEASLGFLADCGRNAIPCNAVAFSRQPQLYVLTWNHITVCLDAFGGDFDDDFTCHLASPCGGSGVWMQSRSSFEHFTNAS